MASHINTAEVCKVASERTTGLQQKGLAIRHSIMPGSDKACQHKRLILTIKHTVWACFVTMGPLQMAAIESTMNSFVYKNILESNVRVLVQQLKHGLY